MVSDGGDGQKLDKLVYSTWNEDELFLKKRFIYLREKVHTRVQWGGAEEEGERNSSRLHAECRALCGARSHDPEIMTCAKTKSRRLN